MRTIAVLEATHHHIVPNLRTHFPTIQSTSHYIIGKIVIIPPYVIQGNNDTDNMPKSVPVPVLSHRHHIKQSTLLHLIKKIPGTSPHLPPPSVPVLFSVAWCVHHHSFVVVLLNKSIFTMSLISRRPNTSHHHSTTIE